MIGRTGIGSKRGRHPAAGASADDVSGPVLIREATESDRAALVRLAELDSASPLADPVLIAFCRRKARAALSLSTGAVVANPWYRSAELIDLLELRAAQLADLGNAGRRRDVRSRPVLNLPSPHTAEA